MSANRTVLKGPELPGSSMIDVFGVSAKPADTVSAITNALASKGIVVIPEGEKFALLVPKSMAGKQFPAPPASTSKVADVSVNFQDTSIDQAADFYGMLTGKGSLDRKSSSPVASNVSINLRTQSALTKEESIYALDTVFLLNGLKVVSADSNHVKIVAADAK